MNTQLLLTIWAAIAAAYAIVVLMRWKIGRQEDDHLHFSDSEQQLVATQAATAHKLDVLDRWKMILLTLTILSALAMGALHVYTSWLAGSTTVQMN